ncbi:YdcF family protein [Microbulbifer sp. 2205BS26-8]|uniref:YdcF family protein n=1 Tax=Microbulbifer sp. 2205BS26-8 TaxID=3064386 RepID=UPI00273FF788|nr:YdcF family protein [Microbulbifer sp. 2205BS26-8]MDP5209335.1 YdcF family protein [Microbulbifer sp. 2205BS26-8]
MIEFYPIMTSLLMPPLAPLLGLLLAFLLYFLPFGSLLERSALPLAVISFAALWVSATPAFSAWLGKQLGTAPEMAGITPQAVVILGGGRYRDRMSGHERLSATSLERVVWAAQKAPDHLPLLVSGGRIYENERLAESQMMAALLEGELFRQVSWREDCSRTTAENAMHSTAILRSAGVKSIVLVTHWWHMPRAAEVFTRAGLQVQPLSVGSAAELLPQSQSGVLRWTPGAAAMLQTQIYWREVLAQVWYRWRSLPPIHSC